MPVNTIAIYIKLKSEELLQNDFDKKLSGIGYIIFKEMEGTPVTLSMGSDAEKLMIFKESSGGHASMRTYKDGTVTLDIQYNIPDTAQDEFGKNHFAMTYIRTLECKIAEYFGEHCVDVRALHTPVKRGVVAWPYSVTGDERLLEFDFDRVAYEGKSPYQTIQIFHSKSNGNVLLLDNDIMLGESDLIYTRSVCALDTEDYTDKEVLILGGGDGGILYELLKLKPKFVLMAEIDEMVIKACRTHMRSVCGDALDHYEGPNHKIMLRDCVEVLHECISSNRKFDYVINDLTEFPVDKAVKGFGYDFETTSLITELSFKAVKDDGKLLARGNCASGVDYQIKFENDLKKMGAEFLRKEAFVPSFAEIYTFYEIWKKK